MATFDDGTATVLIHYQHYPYLPTLLALPRFRPVVLFFRVALSAEFQTFTSMAMIHRTPLALSCAGIDESICNAVFAEILTLTLPAVVEPASLTLLTRVHEITLKTVLA